MFSPYQYHLPCLMFRPDHLVNLTIALPLDDPPRSYSALTFTQPQNVAQRVLDYVHLFLFLPRLPYHSWQPRLNCLQVFGERALFKMWPFDAVTGVGKRTDAFSLRAGLISPSVGSKHSWDVSLWWNHVVIAP
jgi:hypothetical protein